MCKTLTFPILLSGVRFACLAWLFAVSGIARAEVVRFTGVDDISTRTTIFYADPYIQDVRFSGTSPAFTAGDVTLDSTAQTILYNHLTFFTAAPTTRSKTISEIRPGTFEVVNTQATITFDPISITAENIGPLPLQNQTTYFAVHNNTDGSYGSFPTIPLTGTYSVTRELETVSGAFAIPLPISSMNRFPVDLLYVDDYPNSIMLKGKYGGWDASVQWNDWSSGINNLTKRTIFSGIVGGFDCALELQSVYFNRKNNYTTLTAIPEPSTLILLAMGAVGLLVAYAWRRGLWGQNLNSE